MGVSLAPRQPSPSELPGQPGDRIGRYKLVEKIGEGGCGSVYRAEQEEPVRREVALKVIKLGMDTREVIARFEAERQALALMDHPHIAKVLDAGATDAGRPYFVMELARGVHITRFCDQQNLSLRARLVLFIQVCQAIQHAHQKGIIHRDIKPSNVLVTVIDGVPAPRVIDFGIAKATQRPLTGDTLTEADQFLGTPAYMSPEQAGLGGLDIDTRSDIYSLGVLLYEMLTGKTPFDAKELLAAGLDELRRTIREEAPLRPSAVVKKMSELRVESTGGRAVGGATLNSQLKPLSTDLDWIAMKCLEKDRARRYDTATSLAEDLQRHLDHQPVEASPPSTTYRLRKLAQRHRGAFIAVGAVVATLIVGLGVSTYMYFGEAAAVRRAVASERIQRQLHEQADVARTREAAERHRARETADFLTEMLRGVGPSVALGRDVLMLREILDQTARRVGRDLKGQPEVEADLRGTLGLTYRELGDYEQAEAMQREALRLETAFFGPAHERVIRTLNRLALVRHDRGDLPEAESLLRQAFALSENSPGHTRPEAASLRNSLALVLADLGRFAEAGQLLREALAIERQRHGERHEAVATVLGNLAQLEQRRGRLAEAEAACRASLAIYKELLDETHPSVVTSLNNLARILSERNDLAGAETTYREALSLRRKLVGDAHPAVAVTRNNLGTVLRLLGRLDDAEAMHREALKMLKDRFGDAHRDVALSLWYLAAVLQDREDFAGAESLLRQAVAIRRGLSPAVHPETAQALNSLAQVLERRNKLVEAEAMMIETVEMQKQIGEERPDMATCLGNLAKLLRRRGKLAEAEAPARAAVALWRKLLGDENASLAGALHTLGLLLQARSDLDAAAASFRDEVAVRRKLAGRTPAPADAGPSPAVALADSLSHLGTVLRQRRRYDEAETVHGEALELRRRLFGDAHPDVALSYLRLAEVFWGRRDFARAEPLLTNALAIHRKVWTNNPAKLEEGLINLAELRFQAGKFAEAEPLYREFVASRLARLAPEDDDLLDHRHKRDALARLVRLYEAWDAAAPNTGKAAEAAKWKQASAAFSASAAETERKQKGRTPDGLDPKQ